MRWRPPPSTSRSASPPRHRASADVEARRRLGPATAARSFRLPPAPSSPPRRTRKPAPSHAPPAARPFRNNSSTSSRRSARSTTLVTPHLQERLFEISPELALTLLAGAPMAHPKTTAAGRAEHVLALAAVFGHGADRPPHRHAAPGAPGPMTSSTPSPGPGQPSTTRQGDSLRLGGPVDERGLRMEVVV